MTSARSQAMMASSQASHSMMLMAGGKWSRQACARSRPVAMPNRADRPWSRIAIRFDSIITESKV
ncbi:hypothetical protein AD948_10645 [Acetobacter senegalensis]|uniref:Uncharacterized protein n=1 Tax=Acetobacter senegalensis TaxID=446692 RepID=A0A149U066_9PROT|nr:hypothetical protein AD948_10645 [Acetobacter senegalensis]